ncbi:MAG: insulinase family protein [Aquificae bacterium]|nr:insulinase family protein [Aquificota bacterium]
MGQKVKVLKEVLPNGVTILLKPTEGMGIAAGSVFIRGGILDETLPGSTHLTTYLLLKGSRRFDKDRISEVFEDYGGGIGASTADEYSIVEFATKVEGLKEGLEVLGSVLLEPLFPEEDVEREKKNALAAIRSRREHPFRFAYLELKKLTYRGTPYERDTLGDEESVLKFDRRWAQRRWEELLKGGRIVVSLVGDFEKPTEVLGLLRETFSAVPGGEFRYPEYRKEVERDELKTVKREGSQATILCAFNFPHYRSEEYWAGKVLNAVLGDGFTSLLFRELREKKGYAYATTSFYPTKVGSPRLFAYAGTSPEKAADAYRDMLSVIKEMPFGREEVEVAKRKIVGDWLMDHQTRARQAWYLGWFETIGMGFETDFEYADKIREVSFEEVLRVRERYLTAGPHHAVVVSP